MSVHLFEELLNKTMVSVENNEDQEMIFITSEGKKYRFFHWQDCCENVSIYDIVGDLSDLVGSPLLMAEECSCEDPDGFDPMDYESYSWTFYKFATIKGYVDVRWLGSSNGCYSEGVSFEEVGSDNDI